jgi:hypothetical protein
MFWRSSISACPVVLPFDENKCLILPLLMPALTSFSQLEIRVLWFQTVTPRLATKFDQVIRYEDICHVRPAISYHDIVWNNGTSYYTFKIKATIYRI